MLFKKIKRYLKVKQIDVSIYYLTNQDDIIVLPNIEYEIEQQIISKGVKKYYINFDGNFVHHSFLYKQKSVLKVIGKRGPLIGDCVTHSNQRGKSIYPFVINYIAKEVLSEKKYKEVFVLVANKNSSSIRGIEKAGFKLHTKIKAKRFLFFYYNIIKE